MDTTSLVRGPSMLLAFRTENVRSFRDEMEFSMLATALADKLVVREIAWREGGQSIGVVPVAGLYGANASGKSNVLKAMRDMRAHVLHSFRSGNPTGGILLRRPFLLDRDSRNAPSRFEIDFVLGGVRHEYGFAVDDEQVTDEWAFRYPKGRAALLFRRHLSDVEFGVVERTKGRAIKELLRPNALFLSTAASANHPVLLPIYDWFGRNLRLADSTNRPSRQALTTQFLDNEIRREQVLELLHAADLGITGAKKRELDPAIKERLQRAVRIAVGKEEEPDSADDGLEVPVVVQLVHQSVDGNIELDARDVSLGTLVWFALVGPAIEALADGAVFLADELDASMHPALVAQIVRLFQDPQTNPRRAQLIFNSHDATLLGDSSSDRLLGRDQVWFTEKREDGSTRLYALADLDPRKEEAISRRYLAGRYGATPILSHEQFAATAELITAGAGT